MRFAALLFLSFSFLSPVAFADCYTQMLSVADIQEIVSATYAGQMIVVVDHGVEVGETDECPNGRMFTATEPVNAVALANRLCDFSKSWQFSNVGFACVAKQPGQR